MSASDRSSDRVVDQSTNDLASGTNPAISGADGRGLLATNTLRPGRLGRNQLSSIKASLSDRQLSILTSLDRLKFASARQVERLLYQGFDLTPLSAARSSRLDLARLHLLQLIERLDRRIGGLRAGSGSYVYKLSDNGARLLGHSTRRRSRQPSLAHLDHVLEVAELVVQLHETARTGTIELVGLQTEPDCWRPVVGPHGSRIMLKPDLRLTLGVGEHELHWFVEIDRGSEHQPVLTRKCQTYLGAWRDGREQAQAGVFPRVLWVVPDETRASAIYSVIHNLPTAPTGMFVVTTNAQALTALVEIGDER